MAYQNVAAPAVVLIQELAATREFFKRVGKAFENGFVRLMESASGNARIEEVRRLESLSDEELAKLNIDRDRIVFYVFRDKFYM